jgi:hypothetical protein
MNVVLKEGVGSGVGEWGKKCGGYKEMALISIKDISHRLLSMLPPDFGIL